MSNHKEINGVDFYTSNVAGGAGVVFKIVERDPFDLPQKRFKKDKYQAIVTTIQVQLHGEVVQEALLMGCEDTARRLIIGWLRGEEPTGDLVDYADVNTTAAPEFWDDTVPIKCHICKGRRRLERKVDLTKTNPMPALSIMSFG